MPGSLGLEARAAARSPWVERLGRAGLAAKGISYGLVAALAIGVAAGEGGKTTDRQGALRTLAGHGWGKVVLVALAVGFGGYALWRIVDALLDRGAEGDDASGLVKRAGYLARACIYGALCATTIEILAGSGSGGGSNEKRTTQGVLGWPGGRWLVLAVGLAVAAAALWNGYRGLTRTFEDRLQTGRMAEPTRKAAVALGVAGHLARGVVFGIVAWFLIKAAVEFQGKDAVGLDGALAKLADRAYGSVLLGLVAGGLLAYGAYCLVEARYRKV